MLLYADDAAWRIRYEIACGANFATRAVRVEAEAPGVRRMLELSVDAAKRWRTSAGELPAVSGCVDADVSFSPSTNLLPIRRLGLAVGESAEVVAAWILLPNLEVKPLPQRYTRIGESRYRYESRGGAFSVELDVDEAGLVLDYPPFWKRAKPA